MANKPVGAGADHRTIIGCPVLFCTCYLLLLLFTVVTFAFSASTKTLRKIFPDGDFGICRQIQDAESACVARLFPRQNRVSLDGSDGSFKTMIPFGTSPASSSG